MTYLALCVTTRQECRINGTGPTAVAGQTGLLKDIVDWVSQSYTEIQEEQQDWRWLRSTFTVNTVASDDTYAYGDCTDSRLSAFITRFSRWLLESSGRPNITSYLTSAGVGSEGYLVFLPWDAFRAIYKVGIQNDGPPVHITIDPQGNLVVGPKPDAIYTISGEYQMSPQTLTADADVPEMPARFHSLIMYRAMEKYGSAKNAAEVFHRGGYEGARIMRALVLDQLPEMTFGRTLA